MGVLNAEGSHTIAYAILWTVAICLGFSLCIPPCMAIKKGVNKPFEISIGVSVIMFVILRICLIVEIPMLYHRLNLSWDDAE